ncbi:M12 family metallopeptidase [Thermodesulfobacteriota bacterium]
MLMSRRAFIRLVSATAVMAGPMTGFAAPRMKTCIEMKRRPGGPAPLALERGLKWDSGATLRVAFTGGESGLLGMIEAYANVWTEYANIKWAFGDHPRSDIRISFREGGGHWSYIGTDSLSVPPGEPTMNLDLGSGASEVDIRSVTLHEFGHALGCIHEHQNPEGGIPWNVDAVFEYYRRTQGWSDREIEENILDKYSSDQINASEYDPLSIMHYPIPNWLTQGDFEVDWNRALSTGDKAFIGGEYPFADSPSDQENTEVSDEPEEAIETEAGVYSIFLHNKTSLRIQAIVHYLPVGSDSWKTNGWYQLRPGQKYQIDVETDNRNIHVYAAEVDGDMLFEGDYEVYYEGESFACDTHYMGEQIGTHIVEFTQ